MTESHNTSERALARHYMIDTNHIPASARAAFIGLSIDAETRAFLDSCNARPCVDAIASALRSILSVTDVNALLFRGGMFVLSTAQARLLLGLNDGGKSSLSLLDVGAGDGGVTSRLSPLFESVEATEISWGMVLRLHLRGFRARGATDLSPRSFPASGTYDCVALLNLLDRCDTPMDMLRGAARLVRARTGRVLVALVLPFSDFVEDGAKRRQPREPLEMGGARCGDGATFEVSLAAFIQRILPRAGLELESLSRVPYLCRGDSRRAYYVLSDAIMVLRATSSAGGDFGISSGAVLPTEQNTALNDSSFANVVRNR